MNKKSILIYASSFILPIAVLLYCMLLLKAFPFGDNSFLYWDSKLGYINVFSYLKSTFFTNNNLLYSFVQNGGSDMLSNSAFLNVFSPFNIIFFLFPDEYANIALLLLMIIKTGLCGLTFSYFLNTEVKKSYFSILISLSYALSMHTLITILSNFIFMDVLIFLPLILVGVSKIVEKNDYRLYLVPLLLTTLSNGHMGYISILMSAIYFLYKIILNNKNSIADFLPNIKTFIFSTALNIGLCAWFIIPVVNSLPQAKHNLFELSNSLFQIRLGLFELLSKLYTNNLTEVFWIENSPYIFVGILVFVLLILYFFNKGYTKKERIADGIVLLFLTSSLMLNFLFILFNMGVENPHGTIYRFGFVFVLFILYVSYKEIVKISNSTTKDITIAFIIYTIISIAVYLCGYISGGSFLVHIFNCIIFLYFICLISQNKFKNINIVLIALFLIHIANMTINCHYVFKSQRAHIISKKVSGFVDYRKTMKNALNVLYGMDDNFYRIASQETFIEDINRKAYNNSALLNSYDSISGYLSFSKEQIGNLYYHLGVPVYFNNLLITYRDDMQALPISLLGVKYIISSNPYLHAPYEKIDKIEDKLFIYKNPYAFPFAYVIDNNDKLLKDIYNEYSEVPDFQNNIVKIILNNDFGNIYKYKFTRSLKKLIADTYQKTGYTGTIFNMQEDVNFKNNSYLLIYNDNGIRQYIKNIRITGKNLEKHDHFDDLDLHIVYLGQNIDKINIEYELADYYAIIPDYLQGVNSINFFLVEENLDILKKYYEIANNNKCDLIKISSSHITANLNIKGDNKLLFTTIPYDEGWNIKIDGKKRKPVMLFNCLMAIPVYQGDSELEMKYIPKGFVLGILISILSLILLTANILFLKFKTDN